MREGLDEEWVWFQQVLIDSDITLQKHKEKFKNSLIVSSEEFKNKIEISAQEFNTTGHKHSSLYSFRCSCILSLSVYHAEFSL